MTGDKNRNVPESMANAKTHNHPQHKPILDEHIDGPYSKKNASGKRKKGNSNIVGLDGGGPKRISLICLLSPVPMRNNLLLEVRHHSVRESLVERANDVCEDP